MILTKWVGSAGIRSLGPDRARASGRRHFCAPNRCRQWITQYAVGKPVRRQEGCRLRSLRWAVVTTSPIKDHAQPAIMQALHFVGAHITMLLTIAHQNGQLVRISLDRVLPPIHRAEPEHCILSPIAAHIQGHRSRVTE
jgi:hypothetical protein